MYKIPVIYLKDKQVYSSPNLLKRLGKPTNVAKEIAKEGYKLLHIVDLDLLHGMSTNLDVYDKLTYFINVEVECAFTSASLPQTQTTAIMKLLTLKCRVVLKVTDADTADALATTLSAFREKKLLVAKMDKISPEFEFKNFAESVRPFNDVILDLTEQEIPNAVALAIKAGKRIIIPESCLSVALPIVQKAKAEIFGVLFLYRV